MVRGTPQTESSCSYYIDAVVQHSWESELVLPPGTKVVIEKIWVDSDGIKRIIGRVIR